MVVDTSAILAIFLGEAERAEFLNRILQARGCFMSAANVLESGIVIEARKGESAGREFDLFVVRAGLEIVAVDADQAEMARLAWRKFGKGRHPAGLNFGDCFAYALAKSIDEPLLAKGRDFALTDLAMA
jgi:ribonuclease VapC